MTKNQKRVLIRIIITSVAFVALFVLEHIGIFDSIKPAWLKVIIFLVPYLLIGYDIIIKAAKNICHGQIFDENFLMLIATFGAFGVGEYLEAVAVMLFYQIGELFQSYAVGKSRKSISDMMDICPEYANIEAEGKLKQVEPDEVEVGSIIIVKPGERVPLDGIVTDGESMLNTAALTGESVPRRVKAGDGIFSGCINGSNTLRVKTTKAFEDSTVSKILELVENASSKKARTENFITRFAKYYTPAVTVCALLLALVMPLCFDGDWGEWIKRACTFLVISCPCALVISVPLGFFSGIGAASKLGILIKGSTFLEAASKITRTVFDKTGTLTKGEFKVSGVNVASGTKEALIKTAAHAESYSTHPIACALRESYGAAPDTSKVKNTEEIAGFGVHTFVEENEIYIGNAKLMKKMNIAFSEVDSPYTVVYVASNGVFLGSIEISDSVKDGAADAIREMKAAGVKKCIMLTGDREQSAAAVAGKLGIDEYRSQLLPADKVSIVEKYLEEKSADGNIAFVGDGINDAPVLTRADVGIAMGSLGSDAAIEAADIVLMDDDIRKIPAVIRISRKTMRIVKQNIVFSLVIKAVVLLLGALGLASMWAAVFADVGVSVIAILNSMRALKTK